MILYDFFKYRTSCKNVYYSLVQFGYKRGFLSWHQEVAGVRQKHLAISVASGSLNEGKSPSGDTLMKIQAKNRLRNTLQIQVLDALFGQYKEDMGPYSKD